MSKKKRSDGRRNNKPPKHTQFKKGQSGNPNGRPKGASSFKAAVTKYLGKNITIKINGKPETITNLEAIAQKSIIEAIKGNDKSWRFLKPYLDEIDKRTANISDEESKKLAEEASQVIGEILSHVAAEKASLAPGNYQDELKRQDLENEIAQLKAQLRKNGINPDE